jgi:hypothetical protein
MPLPEFPPTFDFNEEKVIQYAKDHFDDYDSALKYLFYVMTELGIVYATITKKFEVAQARFEERYGVNRSNWPREKFDEVIKITNPLGDLDNCNLGIRELVFEFSNLRLQGVNFNESKSVITEKDYSHYRFNAVKEALGHSTIAVTEIYLAGLRALGSEI